MIEHLLLRLLLWPMKTRVPSLHGRFANRMRGRILAAVSILGLWNSGRGLVVPCFRRAWAIRRASYSRGCVQGWSSTASMTTSLFTSSSETETRRLRMG